MQLLRSYRRLSFLAAMLMSAAAPGVQAMDYQDHYEFEASLHAPYRALSDHLRTFDLQFRFPGADDGSIVAWRLDILNAGGGLVRTLRGESVLTDGVSDAQVRWSELDPQNAPVSFGIYTARLRSVAINPLTSSSYGLGPLNERIDNALTANAADVEEQTSDIQVGPPTHPAMPVFAGLPSNAQVREKSLPAAGSLPYTVYLGNLHSQTNLSDGGGDLSTCVSEQTPQTGIGSPTDAYTYAMNEGLDFLMTSEHNHMFDGSTGTNTSANPTTAKALYQSGQTMRDNFNAAHPNFLALAGLEWGVISNGGHLNIFNTPLLLEWEYNSSNQLIGDVYTPKSDYASLYTTMKSNGWIGQFNHPATSGQFVIGGTSLAYSADGDQVMVLCEVMNSSAFSHNTTETETSHNSYEAACNALLEAGYHVAFSSDQDNHCANWGASYTNRTGVLIPNGQALNLANFYAALQARHVYATYDKTSQIVLTTSGGHMMGDQFNNSGALTLTVNYAPGAGRSASQVQIFEGVPGSNGTVSQLSTTAVTTITPANGNHFYYAKITQDNGTLLYSAPVWVAQGAAATPDFSLSASPTSASVTQGSSASDAITITPSGGFTGSVAFSASGLPAGVTAAFSPTSSASSSTLTLTANSTATVGTSTVTITGTSGSLVHSTTLNLTVGPAATTGIPRYDHVIVVIEENTSASSVIGNTAQAPYINSLVTAGANFTQSFAITHPSQPNYLALFSGSTQGITDDSCPHTFGTDNLGNQLITAGFTFAGYSETMPSNGYTGCTSGTSGYARKHNPWVNFSDLAATTNLTYTSFPTDYTTLPTLSFVIPNLCDDMHDCSISTGDTWLKNNLDAYITWAKTHNSLLILTWDEDDSTTTANQIATVFVGAHVAPGSYAETINHYSVLRTLEDMYGLPALGGAATATSIKDVWAAASPDFSASVAPGALSVTQGTSGSDTVTVTSLNGFSAAVNLSVSGLPSGVTAAFAPTALTPAANGSASSTLTLTASSGAPTGTTSVTITGTSGSLTHSATLSLTVNPSAPPPDFSLSASPASATVMQGASATTTITETPSNGFTGAVNLSASGLPAGITASFNPSSTTGPSTLTLTASSTAATGTATVTITGTSGSLSHTTTLALTVNPATTGGQTAVYNATLKAPWCAAVGASCDSGPTLLNGRANLSGGTEPNQPNTINNSCADGTSGTYHSDESNDRLTIASMDGGPLTAGKQAKVTATVWAYDNTSDALDLYYAPNANSPSWTLIATLMPTVAGAQSLSATFTLPTGTLQAVRANFRYQGSASSCSTGSYDDHDDLIFAVNSSAPAPDFGMSASPGSVSVTQGSSVTDTVSIAPQNGFSGSVALSASGLPAGVTASFSPASTTGTSTLTLSAASTAATGTATVTITGTSGALTHTATVNLTVNPAATADFSLSASPTSVSVTQGASVADTISITPKNGFSGTVALSASGLPSGVTASFSPSSTTGTSTLTLSAGTAAATGPVTVTITGSSGSLTHTAALSVTVNPSGGTPMQLLGNTSFESSLTPWTGSSGIDCSTGCSGESANTGTGFAWLDGYGSTHTDTLSQTVTIPAGKSTGVLKFYLHIDTAETSTTTAYDKLTVKLGSTTLATFSNLNAATGYQVHSYNVNVTAGSSLTLTFTGTEDSQLQTSFVIDDVTFTVQ